MVIKRLSDAAARFWPLLTKEERTERVHETLVEILDRETKGETHKISWWAKWMFVRLHHRAMRSAREIPTEDMADYLPISSATQINNVAAREAYQLLKFLPTLHRRVMLLIIDGANPLEISDEIRRPITEVLNIIRDARLWLSDGGCYLESDTLATQARRKA